MQALSSFIENQQSRSPIARNLLAESALHQEYVCTRSFTGHSGAVLALACIDQGQVFVSGSADGTARLWSLSNKFCLRIFSDHSGPVRSIAALDQVTFLTGSDDTTVKVWNALSATSLRTFEGHTDQVTSVTVCHDGKIFLTSSADCTIKIWVLTSIQEENDSDSDDDLFDLNDFTCGASIKEVD
jgi:WD40 repeat protein